MSAGNGNESKGSKALYKENMNDLWLELVKLQQHMIATDMKVVVIFEGRDAAGKDGTIRRFIRHLSPRHTRVVALGKPSDRDQTSWYFQRYVPYLPAAQEIVLFNRSWYNRAGVEKVMGFCTDEQYEEFMEEVPSFEHMLVRSGIHLFKYYLDIEKDEQKKRLKSRRTDPLKQWKLSPIDEAAINRWDDYTVARDQMFARTNSPLAPWTVVRADNKRLARVNIMRDMLLRLNYKGKSEEVLITDPEIVFAYQDDYRRAGMISS